jgi:hypothetical protein
MCYHDLSEMNFNISRRQKNFLMRVDGESELLRDYEEECYLNDRINDRITPVFKNIGMLGCPISTKYGGMGTISLLTASLWNGLGKKEVLLGHSYQLILQLVN